jgi:hypothetical protein
MVRQTGTLKTSRRAGDAKRRQGGILNSAAHLRQEGHVFAMLNSGLGAAV